MKKILLYSFVFVTALLVFHASDVMAERDKFIDIQEVNSDSGITAWLVEDHHVPVIAFDFAFLDAGAKNDQADKQGLSRLVSNTLDEGAGDLESQAFQKELRDLSISLSFNSGRDTFGGSVKTLSKNKERAFALLKLALTEPRFDADPVQRMRQANQSRIRSSLSDPNWMAARLLNDKAYAGHPYALNSGGTLSTLDAITLEDLHAFAAERFSKNRLRIAVAGDITAEELKSVLDDVFGGLQDNLPEPEINDIKVQNATTTYLYRQENQPQTVIEMLQNGIPRTSPDYHKAQIMNFILGSSGFGSRLTEEIREKRGLTYGIYSGMMSMDHFSGLSVSTSTANKNVPEMLSLIEEEFNKMRSYPITEEELENAQSYLIGALPLSLTSTDAITSLLLSLQIDDLPIDYLDQRQKAIEEASINDIFTISQKLLQPENFVSVLVGNPEINNQLNIQEAETLPNVE